MTSERFQEFKERIERDHWMYGIRFDRSRPYFEAPEARCFELNYPSTPVEAGNCANVAALLSSRYFERQYFSGATLWFSDADIFDGWQYLAGRVVIDRIRAGFGDLRPFDEAEVHHFRADEIELLTAFVILAFVLSWDIFILAETDRFLHVSHDEFFCVVTKTREAADYMKVVAKDEIENANSPLASSFCPSKVD
jgi:hypothetical protein